MKRITCPYVGLRDDPSTSLSFPSEGNSCHHVQPVSSIIASHQENFCLSENHVACPVYRAMQAQPMPAELVPPKRPQVPNGYRRLLPLLPALLAGAAALAIVWAAIGAPLAPTWVVPDTGIKTYNITVSTTQRRSTPIQSSTYAGLQAQFILPTNPNCPLPEGWMAYTVHPTDSLHRLSIIYGLRVEELQQKNCLGDSTSILPGQVIYIPFTATTTPIPIHASNTPFSGPTDVSQPVVAPSTTPIFKTDLPTTNPPTPTGMNLTQTATDRPTLTEIPQTVTVPATTTDSPTATRIAATGTAQATDTSVPPTATDWPTQTSVPPTAIEHPTKTRFPWPTKTPRPTRTRWPLPTDTPVPPPTNTPIPPPTNTPLPPPSTDTPIPPPPTGTSAPPYATEASPPQSTSTPEPPAQPTRTQSDLILVDSLLNLLKDTLNNIAP